ncbi:MAG: hypothetical protein PHW73_12650 [Atribacterota bacterium]|nr:hypothetical protein [Atribacterota bacterium]
MNLSKIENNLEKAYEKLTWEERKVLLDNSDRAFWGGEIPIDEFKNRLTNLKNSCPQEDGGKLANYGNEKLLESGKRFLYAYFKERTSKCIFQALSLEIFIGLSLFIQTSEPVKETNEENSLNKEFFKLIEEYDIIKKELCLLLHDYGLTDEQEKTIIKGKIADNINDILNLLKCFIYKY